MKTRKSISKHYSHVIAKNNSLPEKKVKSVLNQVCLNIVNNLKQGYDVRLDDYLTIFVNKESKLKYYSIKKQKQNGNSREANRTQGSSTEQNQR